jgi:hypothetical protein
MIRIDNDNIKIGLKVVIPKAPASWNSTLSHNDPMRLSYPLSGIIVDFRKPIWKSGILIKVYDKDYGFSALDENPIFFAQELNDQIKVI